MVTMKGTLVTLEPLCIEKHAKGYFDMSQDENIHRYTGNTVPEHIGEIEALLKKYAAYFINWMIISNDTQHVIGILRLGKPGIENSVRTAGESAFLASRYWRKGHMKEAKRLFYRYVFDQLAVDMLYADVWAGNTNSLLSLQSYGYKLIETRTEIFSKTGRPAEKHILALSRDDYHRQLKENAIRTDQPDPV